MSRLLKEFDVDSSDKEIRKYSRLAQKCWAPLIIVYDPLKAGSIDSTDSQPHDRAIVRALRSDFKINKNIKGRPECTIFIGNLSLKTKEKSLKEEFNRYGRVLKATIIEDIITGRSKGYGFIEYATEGEAAKAYHHGHKTWIDGNKIFVDMECARLLPGWIPRRLGGGFNGKKESGQLRFGCRERPFKKPIKLLSEKEIELYFKKTTDKRQLREEISGEQNEEIDEEKRKNNKNRRSLSKSPDRGRLAKRKRYSDDERRK